MTKLINDIEQWLSEVNALIPTNIDEKSIEAQIKIHEMGLVSLRSTLRILEVANTLEIVLNKIKEFDKNAR